jgi:hypothetical protein
VANGEALAVVLQIQNLSFRLLRRALLSVRLTLALILVLVAFYFSVAFGSTFWLMTV